MKKTILLLPCALLFAFSVRAQDSTHRNTTTQNHKKAMHRQSRTMPVDSVNEGKITTNPHGKTSSDPAIIKRKKSTMKPSSKNSTDSIR